MNILYISMLPKIKSAGPRQSVPNQIYSQSLIDNIYWVNLNEFGVDREFIESHDFNNFFGFSIKKLKPPFNNPDLVIFQEVYHPIYCKIAYKLKKDKVPYVIIPRSSLTKSAQEKKFLKKFLGNFIMFNRFIKSAASIQYLTEMEYKTSGSRWNTHSYVIPNGIDIKKNKKVWANSNNLKGVFIGRLDIYHKGLDLLIEACIKERNFLLENNTEIMLYGPDWNHSKSLINEKIKNNKLEDIVKLKGEIYDENKIRVLLNSDFFILTSRFEGHPMGLIEALSYGLPCLVTDGTNMANEIKVSNAGWAARNDIDSIRKQLKELVTSKEELREKSRNAIRLSSIYDWKVLAKESHSIFQDILKREGENFS